MTLQVVLHIAGLAVLLATIGLLAVRWRWATRPQRHAVMPVAVTGVVALAVVTASYVDSLLGSHNPNVFALAGWYAAAAIPLAVPLVFIQRRLAHGAVAGLVVELGGAGPVVDLREALSRALGDPSLALGYWFAAESRYVDWGGKPLELPGPDSGRRSTVVERDGQPVAVLIHDAALEDNATLVNSACGGRADAGERAAPGRTARPAGGVAGVAGAVGGGDRRGAAPDRA